ncbi:MAG: hypothetical protein ABI670_11610 [Chloroflexota bacterium]
MPEKNPFSPEAQEGMSQLLADADMRAKSLRAEAQRAEQVRDIWNRLFNFMNKGWYLHIQVLMDQERKLLHDLREQRDPAVRYLEEIYRIAKHEGANVLKRFPTHLEAAASAAGLSIDKESRHPKYTVDDKFFQLELDDRKGTVRISDYEGQLTELPADVGAVIEAVQHERSRVLERPFDREQFLGKLRRQYLGIVNKDGLTDGDAVPIRRITARLGKNEKGFRTDEFAVDLSRLVEQGPAEIDGCQLELQQTKDISQGMLLRGAGGRGYIGYIKFRRTQNA